MFNAKQHDSQKAKSKEHSFYNMVAHWEPMKLGVFKQKSKTKCKTVAIGFASVNGLKMYYEIHGKGAPLVLIHGGDLPIQTSFEQVLHSFAIVSTIATRTTFNTSWITRGIYR